MMGSLNSLFLLKRKKEEKKKYKIYIVFRLSAICICALSFVSQEGGLMIIFPVSFQFLYIAAIQQYTNQYTTLGKLSSSHLVDCSAVGTMFLWPASVLDNCWWFFGNLLFQDMIFSVRFLRFV